MAARATNHVALYQNVDGTWQFVVQGNITIEYIPSHQSLYLVIRGDAPAGGGTTHPIVNVMFSQNEGSFVWQDMSLQRQVALSFDHAEERARIWAQIQDIQTIATPGVLGSDAASMAFWFGNFGGAVQVAWQDFAAALSRTLNVNLNSYTADLQYGLGLDQRVTSVSPQAFSVFLQWFGPLHTSIDSMQQTLAKLKSVIAIQWFHGFITRFEALSRLRGQPYGTFLVRFSSQRGNYALSYVDVKGEVIHTLVHTMGNGKVSIQTTSGENMQFDNLVELVQREGRNLHHPCLKPGYTPQADPDALIDQMKSLNVTEQAKAKEAVTARVLENMQSGPSSAELPAEARAAAESLNGIVNPLFVISKSDILDLDTAHPLGEGMFGVVYKGTWNETPVAVKVLKCQALTPLIASQFKNEVELMSKLNHPNIVEWYGVCTEASFLAMVTEFMDLGSLHSILHKKDVSSKFVYEVTWAQRRKFALDTARGMAYLGQNQIIHRDMKSLNLLVSSSYACKVCDFGLSRVKAQTSQMTGEIGTTLWMAPELFKGKRIEYDDKVDVYSFGIIMWEILTREEPYSTMDSHIAIAVQVAFKGLRPPVSGDQEREHPRFVALMRRCWAASPKDRPPFSEVVTELEAIVAADE